MKESPAGAWAAAHPPAAAAATLTRFSSISASTSVLPASYVMLSLRLLAQRRIRLRACSLSATGEACRSAINTANRCS